MDQAQLPIDDSDDDDQNLADIPLSQEQQQSLQNQLSLIQLDQAQNRRGPQIAIARQIYGTATSIKRAADAHKYIVFTAKSAVRAVSPVNQTIQGGRSIIQNIGQSLTKASQTGEVAKSTMNGCLSKWNLIAHLAVAAIECASVLWDYINLPKENEQQRSYANKFLAKQLSCLATKTLSTFAISTVCQVGGAAIGTLLFPGVGTIVGGILGAIIGVVASLGAEYYLKRLFKINIETGLDSAYEEFAFDKNSDFNVLKTIYRGRRRLYHPDKCIGFSDAQRARFNEKYFETVTYYELIKKDKGWVDNDE